MNLRHVRYFVTVAEELSFTRAAAKCHIEQAPLSRAIKKLEHDLGLDLLLRSTRSVQLTPAGRVFLESAKVVIEELEHGVARAIKAQEGMIGQLNIAHVGSTVYEILPGIIRRFKTSYPLVNLRIKQLTSRDQLLQLITGDIDVGFVRSCPEEKELKAFLLFSEPFFCVVSEGHPLVKEKQIRISLLANYPFIMMMRSPPPSLYQQVPGICAKAGFQPRIAQEVEDVESIVGLVSSGMGVALVPASLRNLTIRTVRYLPLADVAEQADVWLTWPRYSSSATTESFVSCARQCAGNCDLAPE